MDSKRVTLKEVHVFCPWLQESDFRGRKQSWLKAIDELIVSAGEHCPLPLSGYEVWDIFPEKSFQQTERQRMKTALREEKYSNQITRQDHDQERAYLAPKAQAETELVFHSPETVGSWVSRWSDSQVNHYALEGMFHRWSEHFPSMKQLDRWTLKGEPLWRLSVEARFL
ncbi:plasmid SOS inhibition protein A [Pantoea stewartii]|uniref:plasmid SOS inhibition protein A n=1 Tax=Pantoea stewartii TaxID=66269 RepID=UPI0023F912B8|nr:plasmid SOS inhibition protein A [Pantoea stewartii]MDF7788079.1 plasmid SOS inhibition protein A [Pantoea stewartii]